jgi:ABC-2 type transport system permease protein
VAMIQSVILIALAPLAGVIPSVLMVVELVLLCFLISCAITAVGVAIAARMRSMQGFQMIMNFLVMPMYFLSGAMFPQAAAPQWMKVLMTIDPLTYGVAALRGVVWLDAGVGTDPSALSLATNVSVLAATAVVLVAVAALRFSKAE